METATPQSNASDTLRRPVAPPDALTLGRFAAALALALAALFPDVLTGAGTFVFRDFGLFSFPLAHFQRECFWDGELPFWNPLNNCGIPFLAQWSGLALYPPALFYLLLPLSWSLGVFCLLHVFWGGLGMFALTRSLTGNPVAAAIAGAAFAFGGFAQSCLMWHMTTACLSWFPWVILTVQRAWRQGGVRPLALAALTGAMQMLTGPPEMILATWLPVTALWLADLTGREPNRRALILRFVGIVALISALAAPQILPFLELLESSQRSAAYDSGGWEMPGGGWANFILPLFHAYQSPVGVWLQHDQGVLSSYFPGIAVVALAVFCCWRIRTRAVLALAVLSATCLILALGNGSPLYGIAKTLFPPLGFMRYPIKFVFPVCLILPLLAGLGAAELLQNKAARRPWFVTIGALAAALLAALVFARFSQVNDVPWARVAGDAALRATLLAAFALGARAALRATNTRAQWLATLAMIGAVWIDLAAHSRSQNPRVDRTILEPGIESIEALVPRPSPGHSRAMVSLEAHRKLQDAMLSNPAQGHLLHRAALWANANMIENAPVIDGHFPLFLAHEEAVRVALYQADPLPGGLADFLGIGQATRRGEIFDWTPRNSFLPPVTAGQEPRIAAAEAIPGLLAGADFDPRRFALFPEEDLAALKAVFQGSGAASGTEPPRLDTIRADRHRIELKIENDAPTLVTIARAHHGCWKATVDGRPERILRANGAFMAVPVREAGAHEIVVTYVDNRFRIGAILSCATLALLAAAWFASAKSGRRATDVSENAPTSAE